MAMKNSVSLFLNLNMLLDIYEGHSVNNESRYFSSIQY